MNLVKVVKIQSFMETKERKPRWEVSFVAAGVYVPEQIKKCFKCKKKLAFGFNIEVQTVSTVINDVAKNMYVRLGS